MSLNSVSHNGGTSGMFDKSSWVNTEVKKLLRAAAMSLSSVSVSSSIFNGPILDLTDFLLLA